MTKLARIVMRTRFIRETVRQETSSIAGGRTLHTWDDLLSIFPADDRRQDRPHEPGRAGARWPPRAAAASRSTRRCSAARRGPSGTATSQSLLIWGLAQFRVVPAVQLGRAYARPRRSATARRRVELVAARPLLTVARLGRPLTETVVARRAVSLPVRQGDVLGRVEIRRGSRLWGRATSLLLARLTSPASVGRVRWTPGRTLHHLGTSSDDRHCHTQRGDRPDADRSELPAGAAASRERRRHARRRQGDQRRARAEGARRPGRRDRPRRRQHRHAHRRAADRRGDPQRLRAHRAASRARRPLSSTRQAAPTPRSTSGARRCTTRSSSCCSRSCTT